MGEASQQGLVPLALRVVRGFSACEGAGLRGGIVLGLRNPSVCSSNDSSSSGGPGGSGGIGCPTPSHSPARPARFEEGSAARRLAALLAEREAAGHRDSAVVLELHGAGDLHWVAEAISWLAQHGRRVTVRTDRVLPRDAVEAARDARAGVQLRIASFGPAIQAALLGPNADTAARLLLGAQHLRAQTVRVGVLVAPLMPVVHRDDVLESLTRHISAADLCDVAFAVGGWSAARQHALTPLLPAGGGTALARAYGVFDPQAELGKLRLGMREATLLLRQARRIAEHAGLRAESCGCDAQCSLSGEPLEPFRSLLAPDLFAGVRESVAPLADVG